MAKPSASIVIVDDDPEIVGMLSTRLATRGYKVATASDGHAALETCRRLMPDLVLLDVMMPGKSGWEVARALKTDPKNAKAAIGLSRLYAAGGDKESALSTLRTACQNHPKDHELLHRLDVFNLNRNNVSLLFHHHSTEI